MGKKITNGGITMDFTGLTKLIVCFLAVISATVLGYGKIISGDAATGVITAVLGYVFGNGHGIMSANRVTKRSNKEE